jgi:hypothetical protein
MKFKSGLKMDDLKENLKRFYLEEVTSPFLVGIEKGYFCFLYHRMVCSKTSKVYQTREPAALF